MQNKKSSPKQKSIDPKKQSATSGNKYAAQSKIPPQWLYILLLVIVTGFTFFSLKNCELTNWDDQAYVTDNLHIRELSAASIKDMFTTYEVGNYHPLSMLSFALEYHFCKLNPVSYHTTNMILHILCAVMIFFFVNALTKRDTVAFITALLFAIHPMHVESVAWVSERKDVLYSMFFFASLTAYSRYIEKQKMYLYVAAIFLFLLSVLSKAMAVSLFGVIILIDIYTNRQFSWKLVFEKIPFFIVAVVFGIIAVFAQKSTGVALNLSTFYTVPERLMFASYGLGLYLWKMIYPFDLRIFYSYPVASGGYYPVMVYVSLIVPLLLGFLALVTFRKNKHIFFGLLFFITTIILVLQIIPVGGAIIAERYSYIPYVGIFFMIAYFVAQYLEKVNTRYIFIVVFVVISGLLIVQSRKQCEHWRNSATLWTQVLTHEPLLSVGYFNRGTHYIGINKYDLALQDFTKAIALEKSSGFYYNRAQVYDRIGKMEEAIQDYKAVVAIDKKNLSAYNNLGKNLIAVKRYNEALRALDSALILEPHYAEAYYNRGLAHYYNHDLENALKDYDTALSINPNLKEAYNDKAGIYFQAGQCDKALDNILKAQSLGQPVDAGFVGAIQECLKTVRK